MLSGKATNIGCGERRQPLDLARADVGSQGIEDCGDRSLPSCFVVGLRAAVAIGRGDEDRSGIGHTTRVAQLSCATSRDSDTVMRNGGS